MSLTVTQERKSLFAKRELIEKLKEIALSRDISLYKLVNDIFETYIKLIENHIDLEKAIQDHRVLRKAKSIGFILIPGNTWYTLVEIANNVMNTICEEWRKLGIRIAKHISEKSTNVFADFSWILENTGISDVTIRENSDLIEIKIASLKLRKPLTDLITKLIEGFLVGLNYHIVNIDVIEGLITVKATKKGLEKYE
jgi:hypothetical protein